MIGAAISTDAESVRIIVIRDKINSLSEGKLRPEYLLIYSFHWVKDVNE